MLAVPARGGGAGRAPGGHRAGARRAGLAAGQPLIGFCGAPFTLASYAIEGGGEPELRQDEGAHVLRARRVAAADVEARHGACRLPGRRRRGPGRSALQVFDSWAGIALGRDDYCATCSRGTGSCSPR